MTNLRRGIIEVCGRVAQWIALMTFTAEAGVRFPVSSYDIHSLWKYDYELLAVDYKTIHMSHVAGNCLVLVSFKVPHRALLNVNCLCMS